MSRRTLLGVAAAVGVIVLMALLALGRPAVSAAWGLSDGGVRVAVFNTGRWPVYLAVDHFRIVDSAGQVYAGTPADGEPAAAWIAPGAYRQVQLYIAPLDEAAVAGVIIAPPLVEPITVGGPAR